MSKITEEIDDVLIELSRERTKRFIKANRKRMRLTENWAKIYGKRKRPKWTNQYTSHHRKVIGTLKAYYGYIGFATRVKTVKTKKGTKYTLQLYDTLARRLR